MVRASTAFPTCQAALADRPPAGPGWLHEIKFDGYRVIARNDGEQVRLWARTTSDYSQGVQPNPGRGRRAAGRECGDRRTECDDQRDLILCTRLLKLR